MRTMQIKTVLLVAFLAACGGAAWAIPPDLGPSTKPPDNNFHGLDNGWGMAGFLTPHARAVYMLDAKRETRGMTPAQAAGWRRDQERHFAHMTADERDRFQSDLQRRWDKLSRDEKRRLVNQLANIGTQRNSGIQ